MHCLSGSGFQANHAAQCSYPVSPNHHSGLQEESMMHSQLVMPEQICHQELFVWQLVV